MYRRGPGTWKWMMFLVKVIQPFLLFWGFQRLGKYLGPKKLVFAGAPKGDIFPKKSRLVGCLVHPHGAGFSTARPYFLGFLFVKFVSFSFRDVWEPDATFGAPVGFHAPLWKAKHLLVSPTWSWIVYVHNHIWSILFQLHLSLFLLQKTQISPHLIDRHVTCQPGNINPIAGFPGPLLLRPKQHSHGALALFAVGAMPFQCNWEFWVWYCLDLSLPVFGCEHREGQPDRHGSGRAQNLLNLISFFWDKQDV